MSRSTNSCISFICASFSFFSFSESFMMVSSLSTSAWTLLVSFRACSIWPVSSVSCFSTSSELCTDLFSSASLCSWNGWKIITKQEAQRATYRAPEYNLPPFWGISQVEHFCWLIGPINTNLVEDNEILLPVKFHWIPLSGFRREVENVSANQRPGRPFCFSHRPEKHKLGIGRWDLASCQVSLNSIQRFQRRSQKRLSQSEARAAILFFRSAW